MSATTTAAVTATWTVDGAARVEPVTQRYAVQNRDS